MSRTQVTVAVYSLMKRRQPGNVWKFKYFLARTLVTLLAVYPCLSAQLPAGILRVHMAAQWELFYGCYCNQIANATVPNTTLWVHGFYVPFTSSSTTIILTCCVWGIVHCSSWWVQLKQWGITLGSFLLAKHRKRSKMASKFLWIWVKGLFSFSNQLSDNWV